MVFLLACTAAAAAIAPDTAGKPLNNRGDVCRPGEVMLLMTLDVDTLC